MKKIASLLIVSLLAGSLSACADMNKQDVGTVTGSAVGGILGSQFGKGSGRIAAVVGGAVLGGFLGGVHR